MNTETLWIKKADEIPWVEIEEKIKLILRKKENPIKLLRQVLDSLLIQEQYGYFDRELADQNTYINSTS